MLSYLRSHAQRRESTISFLFAHRPIACYKIAYQPFIISYLFHQNEHCNINLHGSVVCLHYVADLFKNFRSSINPKPPLTGTRYKSLLATTTHYPVLQQRTLLLSMCCGHIRLVNEPINTTPGSYCVQIGQPFTTTLLISG